MSRSNIRTDSSFVRKDKKLLHRLFFLKCWTFSNFIQNNNQSCKILALDIYTFNEHSFSQKLPDKKHPEGPLLSPSLKSDAHFQNSKQTNIQKDVSSTKLLHTLHQRLQTPTLTIPHLLSLH
mmetsp:Transcript_56549/g.84056  ORF Transcript_56549/g.84056 Transcript_56549/m.84056 type:complete len:122 (-) Transcript_56549:2182-2547(-)